MSVRRIIGTFLAVVAFAAWYGSAEAQAQVRRAVLSGFVTDASDGQPLAGATAVLRGIIRRKT